MEIILIIIIAVLLINKNKNTRTSVPKPKQWQSNWKWNEETQTWDGPNGQKIKGKPEIDEQAVQNEKPHSQYQENEEEGRTDLTKEYQPKYLFTKNEWYQYKKLREIAEIKKLIICPKVRLLDIVEPRKGSASYMTCLGKIQSKHVDFVICDQDMHIKAIIELDDKSHDTEKGKERDRFVNQVLSNAGYKVIRTRYINNDILDLV